MGTADSILKKLDNATYLLELVRNEIEKSVIDSILEFGNGYGEKLEIRDIQEDDGRVLEGFGTILDRNKGILIEFRDGRQIPLHQFETDAMYDLLSESIPHCWTIQFN